MAVLEDQQEELQASWPAVAPDPSKHRPMVHLVQQVKGMMMEEEPDPSADRLDWAGLEAEC